MKLHKMGRGLREPSAQRHSDFFKYLIYRISIKNEQISPPYFRDEFMNELNKQGCV